ncbi:Mediator of RNA polymerase II transcription subunit 16 [Lecanora helva]
MAVPSYSDDLLATMQAFATQHLYLDGVAGSLPALAHNETFKWHYLSEMFRVLGLQYDYSIDPQPQQIFQNNLIQKCLSTQASISATKVDKRLSIPALVAQTTLELRHVAYAYILASKGKPGSDSELKNPESVHFLVGLVSWLMSLLSFIMDEVFTLAKFLEEDGGLDLTLDSVNQKLLEMSSPALALLTASSTRTFLRLNCANMRGLMSATKAHSGSNPLGFAYRELEAVFQKSPVTVLHFERLILDLDAGIRNTYQSVGIGQDSTNGQNDQQRRRKEERNNIERDILIRGTIPDIHLDAVRNFFTNTVAKLREEIDEAELYFTDFWSLGLTNDETSKRKRKRHPIDIIRRTELRQDAKTKRCIRCGALAEDMLPFRGINMLIFNLQRYCICGSWCMVGDLESAPHIGNIGF